MRNQGGFSIGTHEEPCRKSRRPSPWFHGETKLRIKVSSAKHSVGQARESRRLSIGSQEESGEDSRGVQHRQSGRTWQRSQVDPVLGFKEELGLESRWVQPITQEEPV